MTTTGFEELPGRFKSRVQQRPDGCWEWLGHIDRAGYGGYKSGGHYWMAHRFAYETLVGPIPEGLEIDHLCRVRACVNPDHLEPVTHTVNIRRRFTDYTHCVNGHEFTEANTYTRPSGHRDCRICIRARALRYYHRKRGAA